MQPHGLLHTRLLCLSLSPRVCSNFCPPSQWCCLIISSYAAPFSYCPQSFPTSASFSMTWLFASGGQSIRASVSALVPPMSIQDWFPLGLTGLISLLSKGLSRVFSNTTVQKHQFCAQPSLQSSSHIHTRLLETIALTIWTFVGKVVSLLFNMLSRFVITFLPRSKRLLISWLQSPSAVIFGAAQNKVCQWFHCFPIYLPWSDGTVCHDVCFLNVEF